MQTLKALASSRLAAFIGGAVLALGVAWPLIGMAQIKSDQATGSDLHAQHQAKQPLGDQSLAGQVAELRNQVARLEAALAKSQSTLPSGTGGMAGMGQIKSGRDMDGGALPMAGKADMGSNTRPMQSGMVGMSGMAAGKPPSGNASGTMKPAGGMEGMNGAAVPPVGEMGMMSMKMDQMMGMMTKMMGGMGGGAMQAGASMQGTAPAAAMMDDDTMEMAAMGGGAPAAGAPMAAGGMGMMGMDKMEMAGMMGMSGKGGSSMAMPSALPGFPGASHLYHVGATGFFLDHRQHIALSTEQQTLLNQIKEQTALDKATSDRSVQQAEQDLWKLTAAAEPDNAQIQVKVAEIEKLRGDVRLRFIGAVGRAATSLNDEQRKILTGFAPPVSTAPAAAPMAGGMKHM